MLMKLQSVVQKYSTGEYFWTVGDSLMMNYTFLRIAKLVIKRETRNILFK